MATPTLVPAIATVDRPLPAFVEADLVLDVVWSFARVAVEVVNARGADLGVNKSRSLDAHATTIGNAAATNLVTVMIVSLALLTSVVLVGVWMVLSHPLRSAGVK